MAVARRCYRKHRVRATTARFGTGRGPRTGSGVPAPATIAARQTELVAEVVRQVEPVVDDVSLVNREHRVARPVRLVRHHPMADRSG